MENLCDRSLIRGGAAAVVWSVAAIVVDIVRSGAVFMSRFPGRRAASARFGHAQAIVRRGDPLQFQLWVRIFRLQSRRTRPLLRGDGRIQDFGIMEKCP